MVERVESLVEEWSGRSGRRRDEKRQEGKRARERGGERRCEEKDEASRMKGRMSRRSESTGLASVATRKRARK